MNYTNIDYDVASTMTNATFLLTKPTKPAGEVLLQHLNPIVFSVAAVLGFIGNLLVIIIVVADTQMRRSINTLIAILAVVDLLFAVSLPFYAVVHATGTWPFGSAFCKVSHLQISTDQLPQTVLSNC